MSSGCLTSCTSWNWKTRIVRTERHPTTNEVVIRGIGEMHLRSKLARMQQQYKLELDTSPPQIAYRETITEQRRGPLPAQKAEWRRRPVRRSDAAHRAPPRGAGLSSSMWSRAAPSRAMFMPAVERGVRQALATGVVAGFPLRDIRVTVYDGKTHAVDGKEIAFVTAGRKATIDAVRKASPILLEPMVTVEVVAPDVSMGDLTGDLAGRRGHVTGTQTRLAGTVSISALAPLASWRTIRAD